MRFEVEVKYREAAHKELALRLAAMGATPGEGIEHEDLYFAHPSRDFAATGEAFRIRGEGDGNAITYKGAKLEGPTKTREEIEVGFAEGLGPRADVAQILERLGFRPVAVVRKRRTSYQIESGGRAMTVTLDRAEGLGDFAEVEALADSEGDLAGAQGAVLTLASELGLNVVEPRSYLRMVLDGGS